MSTDSLNCQLAIQQFLNGALEGTRYTQYYDVPGGKEGCCSVVFLLHDDVLYIFCESSADNTGMSITNAAPAPWEAAQEEISEQRAREIWLEVGESGAHQPTFDRVELRNNQPRWMRLPSPALAAA